MFSRETNMNDWQIVYNGKWSFWFGRQSTEGIVIFRYMRIGPFEIRKFVSSRKIVINSIKRLKKMKRMAKSGLL